MSRNKFGNSVILQFSPLYIRKKYYKKDGQVKAIAKIRCMMFVKALLCSKHSINSAGIIFKP